MATAPLRSDGDWDVAFRFRAARSAVAAAHLRHPARLCLHVDAAFRSISRNRNGAQITRAQDIDLKRFFKVVEVLHPST